MLGSVGRYPSGVKDTPPAPGTEKHGSVTSSEPRTAIFVWFAIILALLMASLLVRDPMPIEQQRENCVVNIQIAPHLRLLLNCDAAEFMRLGYDPSGLFEPGNPRQSRPLFVVSAHVISWVFKPISAILQPLVPTDTGPNPRNAEKFSSGLQHMVPTYLAYLSINIALLMASIFVLIKAIPRANVSGPDTRFALVCAGSLLFTNDVVTAFVWSPHTQMLNIFVPILACHILARPPSRRGAVATAAVAGLGMLAYANMVILLGAILLSLLRRRSAAPTLSWPAALGVGLLCVILFIAPSVVWAAGVRMLIGSYEVVEITKYNELVWLVEAWRAGLIVFAEIIFEKFIFFFSYAMLYAIPAVLFFSFAALRVAFAGQRYVVVWWSTVKPVVISALGASALSIGFFIAVGWAVPRLAFAAVPPLIVLACAALCCAATVLPGGWKPLDRAVMAMLAAAQFGYIVIKDGPWS